MMDRLANPAKIVAFDMAEELKDLMRPLFQQAPRRHHRRSRSLRRYDGRLG